ncbi:MAG: insulinase family protein [Thermoplasmata archaeon]|nr:insulinase family protein [Thermoplasmata archaeon]MCI4359468.1 insulinase family protein [Thermoplasmata archaeon]
MRDDNDPLIVRRSERSDGLVVARQAPPASTASCSATYLAPAGSAYDPPSRVGLAIMTNHLVTSGAGSRDRVTLARDLDRLGATLQAHCHPESAEVTVWGPAEVLSTLLSILADVVLRPRFRGEDLERVRRQLFERQMRELSQPESRAEREMLRAVFPTGHPYRETGAGTHTSVSRIDRNDLIRFHRDHFTASGAQVVVTSPRSGPAILSEVNRRFRDFERETSPPMPTLPPTRRVSATPHRIDMPGRSQVEILLGGASIPRDAPEFAGAFLANEVLGGRPLLSRLFQRVREAHGLAYHASSELEAMRWGGLWMAQAGTGPERIARVLPILSSELERIRSERVGSGELDEIRESAIGEIPLGVETTSGAHDLAVEVTYFGLAPDFFRRWPATLRSVTPKEIQRSAEVAMDSSVACTVIAGPSRSPRASQ